ncbi:AdhP Zn-dependent alcohol dehydrogenases [Candidatus Nanopelagicaceae bacterium]
MNVRGLAALTANAPLTPYTFSRRDIGPNDVAVAIKYAGICHSDIHQVKEEWGGAIFPMVPGHEISGVVSSIGSAVSKFAVGDLIGIGVFIDSCRNCANCNQGLEQYCESGMTPTYNGLERDGITPTMGGYSDGYVINENYAVKIPANLDLAAVAPLLCAGITLYSPLKYWNAGPGKKIAVMGFGGLGHMGVKFAHAMGAEVTVLSHSPSKEADARKLGADHFVVTSDPAQLKNVKRSFDLILNTVSAEHNINDYLGLLATNGTLVVIGLPGVPFAVNADSLLSGRRSMAGSMIGGVSETQEMLNFCGEKNIVSEIELIDASYVNEAYERTIKSDVRFRFVIDIATL